MESHGIWTLNKSAHIKRTKIVIDQLFPEGLILSVEATTYLKLIKIKGTVSGQYGLFCLILPIITRPQIAMELKVSNEITCKWQSQRFETNKYVSWALFSKLQTAEIDFEKLLGWTVFKNSNFSPFQSSSVLPICDICCICCVILTFL